MLGQKLFHLQRLSYHLLDFDNAVLLEFQSFLLKWFCLDNNKSTLQLFAQLFLALTFETQWEPEKYLENTNQASLKGLTKNAQYLVKIRTKLSFFLIAKNIGT